MEASTPTVVNQQKMVSLDEFGVCQQDDEHGGNNNDATVVLDESMSPCEQQRLLFRRAYRYLNPSRLFRSMVYLYAERKMLVFFGMHFVATMAVYLHFFLIKFYQKKSEVPPSAPFYTLKTTVPPLEFGAMHAILLQFALLPLTMSRFTLASLSSSNSTQWVRTFVPLNRAMNMHIYVGYLLTGLVFLATAVFFAFFGFLCSQGEQGMCDKFTQEIMITGYYILGLFFLISLTSYSRHVIRYEIFYYVHHVVFVLYALLVAHTFDLKARNGQLNRSQNFKWFSLTLLYYICDRCAMHFFHSHRTRLVSCNCVVQKKQPRLLWIKLNRPPLMEFCPGQYAFLQVPAIDPHWHPFSIASAPDSEYLEFYMECFEEGSWTDRLWKMVQREADNVNDKTTSRCLMPHTTIEVHVQGPCGSSLAETQEYSHALAIGTGTGIVPVLSLFTRHVNQLKRLAPQALEEARKQLKWRMEQQQLALEQQKGSFLYQLWTYWFACCKKTARPGIPYDYLTKQSRTESLRESIQHCLWRFQEDEQPSTTVGMTKKERRVTMKEFKQAAFETTRSMYGVVVLSLLPVCGVVLLSLSISWNTLNLELPLSMYGLLQTLTLLFQTAFAIVSLAVWDANHFMAYTDAALVLVTPFADWYWFFRKQAEWKLESVDIVTYCLLIGYMTTRTWSMTVKPRTRCWGGEKQQVLQRLDVVWICRSAPLAAEILPTISAVWQDLVATWGSLEQVKASCRFQLYVTDKSECNRRMLEREVASTLFYQNGYVHFGRPNLDKLLQDHSIDMIQNSPTSYTLLSYVGSPQLAKHVHECKLFNDMKVSITGNKKHQMDFCSESYGGVRKKSAGKEDNNSSSTDTPVGNDSDPGENETSPDSDEIPTLTEKRTVSFEQETLNFRSVDMTPA